LRQAFIVIFVIGPATPSSETAFSGRGYVIDFEGKHFLVANNRSMQRLTGRYAPKQRELT
jgi:hypothetical protein